MPGPINGSIPSQWESYVTQNGIGLEVVPHILYDTATYVSATTVSLAFFQTSRATLDLSNVQNPGLLPNPQAFLIQNIAVGFKVRPQTADSGAAVPTSFVSLLDDMVQIINNGIFRMVIGEKRYGPWPLSRLPISTGVKASLGTMAGAEAANITQTYGITDGPLYALMPNLLIAPLQQFSVTLEWPAGALTTSATNTIMTVLFDGQLSRAIQ